MAEAARFHPTFDAALALHKAGAAVLPIRYGDKIPLVSWGHVAARPQAFSEALSLFKPYALDGANVAVICGQRSTRTRSYWTVLDVDDPSYLDDMARAMQRACGTKPAMTQTGRGFQFVARSNEPMRTTKHHAGELRGRGAYSVMPPSLHPNGRYYEWLRYPERMPVLRDLSALRDVGIEARYAHETTAADMEAVRVGTPKDNPGDVHTLPRLARAIFTGNAKVIALYLSRSEVDFAFFVTLANIGMDADTIAAWALRSQHNSHWRGRKESLRWLYSEIGRAIDFAQQCTPEWAHAQETARDMCAIAWQTPWHTEHNVRGESMRSALLAHADTVATSGRTEYQLSRRDGATLARTAQQTFSTATKALCKRGIIQQTKSASKAEQKAGRYAITENIAGMLPAQTGNVGEWLNSALPIFQHDAWERAGLGKSARAVYAALSHAGPCAWRGLCEHTGMGRRAVFNALSTLRAHKLARPSGAGTWCAIETTPDALDTIARRMGVSGRGARRAAQHRREQDSYRRAINARKDKGGVKHDRCKGA